MHPTLIPKWKKAMLEDASGVFEKWSATKAVGVDAEAVRGLCHVNEEAPA